MQGNGRMVDSRHQAASGAPGAATFPGCRTFGVQGYLSMRRVCQVFLVSRVSLDTYLET